MIKEATNVTVFKDQLLRVISQVYAAFPQSVTITTEQMSEDGLNWLLQEGVIRGEIGGGLSRFFIHGATLSGHAISLLQRVETNSSVPGETLGQLAVRTVSGSNERDQRVVADLIARRLLSM